MTMQSWNRKLFTHPITRKTRKATRRVLLTLETLEDRCCPSTFTVINTLDNTTGSIVGSLRWAVNQANATKGADTINFDSTVFSPAKTITLTGSQLVLSDTTGATTITGPAAGVKISGGGLSGVFQVGNLVSASISGLTISGGKTTGNGGGLDNLGGSLTLTNCTVSSNSAGSVGGGLYTSAAGTTTLSNCTISGNSATVGGGANSQGTLSLTNCTVSGNTATTAFGGLESSSGTLTLTNTIVAGNAGGADLDSASPFSGTNNLIGGNPLLAPLNNYGGPTQTLAPLPGSPAIDAGTSTGAPTTDQRGLGRVGTVDIGAFESQGFTLTAVAGGTSQTASILTPFAKPLAVTVTANNASEPVNGGLVSFAPNQVETGAAAILASPSAVIASGQASVTAAPNNADGSYTVVASATGSSPAVSFTLTNTGPTLTSLVVNTTSGVIAPGAGLLSLPEAVGFANLDTAGISSITFDATVFATPQTITLKGTQLELSNTSEAETITGPASGVTISGGGLSRVFQVDGHVSAFLSGLTIKGGTATAGGGLDNLGVATLIDCTVSGNSATTSNGGGLDNQGTATLTNCTVSGNSATVGGGVNSQGTLSLTNCTVSGNSATTAFGGLDSSSGTLTLTNTIVAGNFGGADLGSTSAFSGTNNLLGGNALLAPLGNYGGPTQTMALLPGSPAIDAGTGNGAPTSDQRGLGRFGTVDIGAFESQGFTLTPVAGSTSQTSPILTPFAKPLAVTVTANNPSEPVNGGLVSFVNNPVNGAAAVLAAPSAVIAGGQATSAAAPNNADGSYTVVASVTGSSPAVSFTLTNTGPTLASLVVNTTSGSLAPGAGLLSLPEAVGFASFDTAGISAITFDPTVFATPQTITLKGTQLELSNTSETEAIIGPAKGVTISGGGLSRVFQVDSGVSAFLSGLTISGGTASVGGGLDNQGTATLTDCTISGNSATTGNGGGLDNQGTATLTNCTISGNSAIAGGGLDNLGTLSLTNTTVGSNTATKTGGGLLGIGTTTLTNTIVAGNSAPVAPDVAHTATSLGYNLIGKTDGSSGWVASDLTGTVASPLNPLLGSLANNGGPTPTMALLNGSPAINAGTSAGAPPADQRGDARVNAVDIGAFESNFLPQTISFSPLAGKSYGDPDFKISATVDTNLTVTFTASGKASVYQDSTLAWFVHITGAGTANITAHQAGNASYDAAALTQPLSIAPASATIGVTAYTNAGTTYNGIAHTANGTATGIGNVDLSAGLNLNGTTHTNAGTYTGDAWTFHDANGNYKDASGKVDDSIAQASAKITVTGYSVTYDGNAHTATGKATGVAGVILSTGLNLSGTTHTNAGNYTGDAWTFHDPNGNYADQSGTVNDSIAQASAATIVVTAYTSASTAYDGNAHTATGTATGVGGANLASDLTLSGTTHTNAGTYTGDAWTFHDPNGNYPDASGKVNDSIAQASAVIVITPYTIADTTFDGNAHTATGTATGIGGVNLSSDLNLSGTTHTSAGAYPGDPWSFHDASGNYKDASGTVGDSIARVKLTFLPTSWMAQLPNSLPLTDLSMPGTSNSASGPSLASAFFGNGDLFTKAEGLASTAIALTGGALSQSAAAALLSSLIASLTPLTIGSSRAAVIEANATAVDYQGAADANFTAGADDAAAGGADGAAGIADESAFSADVSADAQGGLDPAAEGAAAAADGSAAGLDGSAAGLDASEIIADNAAPIADEKAAIDVTPTTAGIQAANLELQTNMARFLAMLPELSGWAAAYGTAGAASTRSAASDALAAGADSTFVTLLQTANTTGNNPQNAKIQKALLAAASTADAMTGAAGLADGATAFKQFAAQTADTTAAGAAEEALVTIEEAIAFGEAAIEAMDKAAASNEAAAAENRAAVGAIGAAEGADAAAVPLDAAASGLSGAAAGLDVAAEVADGAAAAADATAVGLDIAAAAQAFLDPVSDAAAVAADAVAGGLDAAAGVADGLEAGADVAADVADGAAAPLDQAAVGLDEAAAGEQEFESSLDDIAAADSETAFIAVQRAADEYNLAIEQMLEATGLYEDALTANTTANAAAIGAKVTDGLAVSANTAFLGTAVAEQTTESHAQVQTQSIADQFTSGIRSLNLPCALVNDTINVNSGQYATGYTLQDVLNDATQFLQNNPNETIVITLSSNASAPLNSSHGFNTDLNNLLNQADASLPGHTYKDFMYYSSNPTATPTLGQVRGKIVIVPVAGDPWTPSPDPTTHLTLGWQANQVIESSFVTSDLGTPSSLYINNLSQSTVPEVTRTAGMVMMHSPSSTLIAQLVDQNNLAIDVTSDSDAPGDTGTLRDAINLANIQPGLNTIEFASNLTGPTGQVILLQSNLPTITNDLDLAGSVYIDGNGHQAIQAAASHNVREGTSTYSAPVYINVSGPTVFDHVAFATTPATLTAGVVSGNITLQLQNAVNKPVTVAGGAPPLVVSLATNSTSKNAKFLDSRGNTISSVSFTAGNNSVSFHYYDEKRANPTLTATTVGVAVSQKETVNANVPANIALVLAQQPTSALANTSIFSSKPLLAQPLVDRFGNLVASFPVTVTLNPVNVPGMANGSTPVLSNALEFTDTNGLVSFPASSINLPGTYTVTVSITVNGKKISVTSNLFTISASPTTPATSVR
jgi:hypothetical protein